MENQVEEVKNKTDILEVVGSRVELKRAGRNFKGLCPFHGEKTPSFFVTPDMQTFKCFGCGESGDVYTFLQNYEGMTFVEALEALANKAGVKLTRRHRGEGDKKRERLLTLLNLAGEYYQYLLLEHKVGEKARGYLKGRGIHRDSWKKFQLGYAAESWQGLENFLVKKKRFSVDEMVEAGMSIRSRAGRSYDRFRGRIMFPQRNMQGVTVGFSGRLMDKETKEAKYVNTPETRIYHKGKILYGLSSAKKSIREKDRVVVTEGELDVISSAQVGVKEVVAVKGSALTDDQLQLIRRLTRNVYLALDADEAGQEAIKRAIELAEGAAMNLRVVKVEGGKDPDDIAQNDPKAWKKMVKEAVSVYQFYLDMAFSRYDAKTGGGQKSISQLVIPVLTKIENAVEQTFYVKKLANMLGVTEAVVEREMSKETRKVTGSTTTTEEEVKGLTRRERLERMLVAILMHLKREGLVKLDELEDEWFKEGYLGRAVKELKVNKRGKEKGVTELVKRLGEAEQKMLEGLFNEEQSLFEATEPNLLKMFDKGKRDLRRTYLHEEMKRLVGALAAEEVSEEEVEKLRGEYRKVMSEAKKVRGD